MSATTSDATANILNELHFELKGKQFRQHHVHSLHRAAIPGGMIGNAGSALDLSTALSDAGVSVTEKLPDTKRGSDAQACFCSRTWQPTAPEKASYITFNDAAISQLTEKGLTQLTHAKATGFIVG